MVALELFVASSLYTAGSVARYFHEKMRLEHSETLEDNTYLVKKKSEGSGAAGGIGVKKFIELSVENKEIEPPMYIGPHAGGISLGVPIGGGVNYEMRRIFTAAIGDANHDSYYNWTITDLDKHPCSNPSLYWLNTPDDLKNFFDANGISQNIIPLRLPLQIREVTIPKTVGALYSVPGSFVMGTNRHAVIQKAALLKSYNPRLFPIAACVAAGTGAWLWASP